jgi:hypothetical protein
MYADWTHPCRLRASCRLLQCALSRTVSTEGNAVTFALLRCVLHPQVLHWHEWLSECCSPLMFWGAANWGAIGCEGAGRPLDLCHNTAFWGGTSILLCGGTVLEKTNRPVTTPYLSLGLASNMLHGAVWLKCWWSLHLPTSHIGPWNSASLHYSNNEKWKCKIMKKLLS